MRHLGQNKAIGNKAEAFVMRLLKKRRLKPVKAEAKQGYDIKVGKLFIEVKGTDNPLPNYFQLSEKEFDTACKNKNYRIYWVDTKRRKLIKILSRDDILQNSHVFVGYRLYLNKLRKRND